LLYRRFLHPLVKPRDKREAAIDANSVVVKIMSNDWQGNEAKETSVELEFGAL
jgi:hypothetical protein